MVEVELTREMADVYDVVVVGAGIFGSCTAYHCQKKGLRTLLVEQVSESERF